MKIDLAGEALTRVLPGYAVILEFSGSHSVKIESLMSVHGTVGLVMFDPERGTKRDFAHLDALVGAAASRLYLNEESGQLNLVFADGRRIIVDRDEQYEAWTYSGPRRHLVVCLPGGKLAEFPGDSQ